MIRKKSMKTEHSWRQIAFCCALYFDNYSLFPFRGIVSLVAIIISVIVFIASMIGIKMSGKQTGCSHKTWRWVFRLDSQEGKGI